MIRKNDLLRFVHEQAFMEAKKHELGEYEADVLVAAATDIIDDLFMSITYEHIEGGRSLIGPLPAWSHRGADDMESDWRYMHFSRAELRGAAERYLDKPLLRYRELDWLIVNALAYADCLAAIDSFRSRHMPFSRYILKTMRGIKWQASSRQWRVTAFLVKWLVWLVIFAITFSFTPVAAVAWAGITLLWQWLKWRAQKRFNNLMATMIATYETLSSSGLLWQTVYDALKKSRGAGAVWDDIIFRLVEERASASSERG